MSITELLPYDPQKKVLEIDRGNAKAKETDFSNQRERGKIILLTNLLVDFPT